MEWTKDRIRELRMRMGWSQSDLARHLQIGVESITHLENGAVADFEVLKSKLALYWRQAESLSEEVQISALAEKVIEDKNLSQLFNSEIEIEDKYID